MKLPSDTLMRKLSTTADPWRPGGPMIATSGLHGEGSRRLAVAFDELALAI